MTRFMITLEQGVDLVWHAFEDLAGGEIYVRKTPSMKVTDLARAILPIAKFDFVGIRPGEKLHEQMVGVEDAHLTYEYDEYFKILPAINNWGSSSERIKNGQAVKASFIYNSETNTDWMSVGELSAWVQSNKYKLRIGN
jgi:FlaA1/EpsC-like NDP-sugar epimerase